MEKTQLTVNGKPLELQIDPTTPLLWALRDHLDSLARNTDVESGSAASAL